ncbi:cytochrome C [Desulfurivibrio sp. D14AmB]|uniref:cytochrome C n=1 Tax=Desulfurivibrio sp. D14AmB TaxID=3374370 RepID=UPI00376F2C2F
MKSKREIAAVALLLAATLSAGPAAVWAAGGGSVRERIEAAVEPFDPLAIESAHAVPAPQVTALEPGPGGTFQVLARKGEIGRFRCSSCHTEEPVESLARDGVLFTHGDITVNHGSGENRLACLECHDQTNRDFLVDKKGEQIDFDHSYQLCGQCHFRQKRDWLGGAHGKRVASWAGERVVKNCTTCHDPHAPAFPVKMPETYSLPLDR